MNVQTLTLGALAANCYLVWSEQGGSAVVVDCPGTATEILSATEASALNVSEIVLTHGHGDHVEALAELKAKTGAAVAVHELDAPMLSDPMLSGAALFGFHQDPAGADRLLAEGDEIAVPGGGWLTVFHTPGHSPGSICLLGEGVLFSGDCLFAGGIGRVDLPGGDERAMLSSLARLAQLDEQIVVYPGHGPPTTIGDEVAGNPWLGEL